MLPQLRQMFSARQSAEMPVKNQQQPLASVIFKSIHMTIGIAQFERCCRFANRALHVVNIHSSVESAYSMAFQDAVTAIVLP